MNCKNLNIGLITGLMTITQAMAEFKPSMVGAAVTTPKAQVTVIQGRAPSIALSISDAVKNTPYNLSSNPTVVGKVLVKLAEAPADTYNINLVGEVGLKMVDANGVIYTLASVNTMGTICSIVSCTYQGILDLSTFKGGAYKIFAYAKSLGGLTGKTTEFAINLPKPIVAPSISLTSPADGSTVAGSISIAFNSPNNVAITSVTVTLDGNTIFTGKNSPATFNLDTRSIANGSHVLKATATDINNSKAESPSVTIKVSNAIQISAAITPNPISGGSPILNLNDANTNNNVFIAQSGSNILVSSDNIQWTTHKGPFQQIIYRGNAGVHNVSVLSSVAIENTIYCAAGCSISASGSLRNTIVTIDPAVTHKASTISGNSKTSVWAPSMDTVSGVSGIRLHRLDQISYPAEPSDINKYGNAVDRSAYPLWGLNPSMSDVNQGSIGDCYFLAPLASMAGGAVPNTSVKIGNIDALRELAVELPNGTVLTQWRDKKVANKFLGIVVTKKLSPYFSSTSPKYGWDMKGIWVPVLEKAWAYYRSGQNTYASTEGGYLWEDVQAFGYTDRYDYNSNGQWYSGSNYQLVPLNNWKTAVNTAQASKQVVTLASVQANKGVVIGGHAYSFLWIRQQNGQSIYTVRNPWGYDPSGGVGGGVLELTESQFMSGYSMEDYSTNMPK